MKKLLIGLAVIIVVVVAAAIVVPFFVPIDTYKNQLITRVKAATGRDLKIAGPVKFSLLPVLGLEASQVSFSNAPGASTPDMLQLGKLQVALKLFPLLSGEVAIDQFVLNDPVIALEVDKQGRPNWSFGAAPAAGAPAAAPAQRAPAGGGASALNQLRLDDVRLVNGKLSYLDQRTGQKQELDAVNVKLSLPSFDGPFAVDGAVTWRSKQVKATINIANPHALVTAATTDAAIKIASDPIAFDYKGKITNANPMKVEGPIDLKIPSVRGLAEWTGNPLKIEGKDTFGLLEIKGNLAMVGSKIGFADAQLAFDAIKAKGEFAFEGGGARPKLQGKLDVDKLDVNPYLPPEGGGGGGAKPAASSPPAKSGWSDAPIDLSGLRAADADFALTVGSMLVRKIQIGQSALGLQLNGGKLVADLSKLALYQGAGKGRLAVDGSGAVPGIDASFNLSGVQAEPLLKDAAGMDRFTGVGAFDIAVTGHGHSQREIVGTLNGKGDLKFTNGVIKGFDLGAMIKNVTSAFGAGGGQTEFSQLTGTYAIANGILKNDDMDLQAPIVHATGAGTVDLPQRTLNYRIKPLNANIAGVNLVGLSIAIEGPWDNLSYRPDISSAAVQGVVSGAGKALQGLVPGQGGKSGGTNPGAIPGQVLKGLFK